LAPFDPFDGIFKLRHPIVMHDSPRSGAHALDFCPDFLHDTRVPLEKGLRVIHKEGPEGPPGAEDINRLVGIEDQKIQQHLLRVFRFPGR